MPWRFCKFFKGWGRVRAWSPYNSYAPIIMSEPDTFGQLFQSHRYLPRCKDNIDRGVHYKVNRTISVKGLRQLEEAKKYGNHKPTSRLFLCFPTGPSRKKSQRGDVPHQRHLSKCQQWYGRSIHQTMIETQPLVLPPQPSKVPIVPPSVRAISKKLSPQYFLWQMEIDWQQKKCRLGNICLNSSCN